MMEVYQTYIKKFVCYNVQIKYIVYFYNLNGRITIIKH